MIKREIITLRELWRRFKQWQLNAFDYQFDKRVQHHCVNCENTYTGNYCPYCSQKAGKGKITWSSIREGIMEVWGMHSRSLPYSLWQLVFRPGHMISDYINGKRQVSFPPVKMLIILGVISVVIDSLFVVEKSVTQVARSTSGDIYYLKLFLSWLKLNPGWGWLFVTCFLLVPTWSIFRYAPRNGRHTLPQGFFIQVFMSIQVLLVDDLSDIFSSVFLILIPLCYMYTNRQLFNYGPWGTIWRTLLVLVSGMMLAIFAMYTYDVLTPEDGQQMGGSISGIVLLFLASNLVMLVGMGLSKYFDLLRLKHAKSCETPEMNDNNNENEITENAKQ